MDKSGSTARALSLFTNLGITMAASVWLGYFIGDFIDDKLHSFPWFTLVFSLSGIGAGFKGIFRILRESESKKQ